MELHQLRYLVLLAEELSFTRAAARGRVAQPALSRQIRKLEDDLGIPLVDRTTRRVSMTPAGTAVVERARRILDEVEATRALAEGVSTLLTGRLAIGMTPTPGPFDGIAALAAYHRLHPGVELVLREDLSVALADQLRRDALDVAFVSAIPDRDRAGLQLLTLSSEDLRLIVGPQHPLAGRRTVRMEALAAERFVAFPEGATIRRAVEDAARAAGFTPAAAFESNEPSRLRALVARGLGVSFLPASDVDRPGPEVASLALRGRRLTYEVLLAWRRERRLPPAAAAFVDALRAGSRVT
ncbi:MAG TPA: LysR substrate-binding domain-containing protein [Baekduia sp.]